MDKEYQINSIVSFVDRNRESTASKIVCMKVLGEKDRRIDDELVKELKSRLPKAKDDIIEDCFQIIN